MDSGNQIIAGTKTFSSTISGNISGNAGTVTNGIYTTSSVTALNDVTSAGVVKLSQAQNAQNLVVLKQAQM